MWTCLVNVKKRRPTVAYKLNVGLSLCAHPLFLIHVLAKSKQQEELLLHNFLKDEINVKF